MTTLSVNEKFTSDSYPYGRLKCTATFSVEFDKKKGFRSVFQTVNPKTGRLNAPKKSTYSNLVIMQNVDGFINNLHYSLNGNKEMNNGAKIIAENFASFTPEQIEFLYLTCIAMMKVSMKAAVIYCNSKVDDLKPLFSPAIAAAVEGLNTKTNTFANIVLDVAAIDATKEEGYNPFVIKESFVIG